MAMVLNILYWILYTYVKLSWLLISEDSCFAFQLLFLLEFASQIPELRTAFIYIKTPLKAHSLPSPHIFTYKSFLTSEYF